MLSRLCGRNFIPCLNLSCRSNLIETASIYNAASTRMMSSKNLEEARDKPLEYIGSPASKWKAEYTRVGPKTDNLWYQPYVVVASVAAFMLYFCVLREENDIDLKMGQSLYKSIPTLEKQQLMIAYKYNKDHGLDVKDLEARLKEINEEELKKSS